MAERKEIARREETPISARKRVKAMVAPVDIYENDAGLILLADMPGASSETLDVKVEDNVLYLKGTIAETPGEEVSPEYVEVRGREYFRAFTLGPEFDQNKIEASFHQGTLRLFIPKHETQKPKKIEIKTT